MITIRIDLSQNCRGRFVCAYKKKSQNAEPMSIMKTILYTHSQKLKIISFRGPMVLIELRRLF